MRTAGSPLPAAFSAPCENDNLETGEYLSLGMSIYESRTVTFSLGIAPRIHLRLAARFLVYLASERLT